MAEDKSISKKELRNEDETPLMYVEHRRTQTCIEHRSCYPSEHDERESHNNPSTRISEMHDVHSQASMQSEHYVLRNGNTEGFSSLMSQLQLHENDRSRDNLPSIDPSVNGTPVFFSNESDDGDRVQSMLSQPLFPVTPRAQTTSATSTVSDSIPLSTTLYSVCESVDRLASHGSVAAHFLQNTQSLSSNSSIGGNGPQLQEINEEDGEVLEELPRCEAPTSLSLPVTTYQVSCSLGSHTSVSSQVSRMDSNSGNSMTSLQASNPLQSMTRQMNNNLEINLPANFMQNTQIPMRMPPSNFGMQCVNDNVKRIFHSLIPHVNSGQFNIFFTTVNSYEQDMARDVDVHFIVRYLESCVYMYQNKADKCREAVSDALNIVPRTSSPNKFKVDILAIQSWLQLKRGRLDHVDETLMGALQTHYQDRDITSGKAAGWIHIQDARLDQTKMTGRHDDAVLRSQSIKSLVFALEQFVQEIDKDGITGEGVYGYTFAALKLVSILLFCDEGMKVVRGELSKDEHIQVLELLVKILACNKANLDMHMTNLRVALSDYYLKFGNIETAQAYIIDALKVAHDPEAKKYCQTRFDYIMEKLNDPSYQHQTSYFTQILPSHFENLNEQNCLAIRHAFFRVLRFLKYKVSFERNNTNSQDFRYMWEECVIPGTSLRDNQFALDNLLTRPSQEPNPNEVPMQGAIGGANSQMPNASNSPCFTSDFAFDHSLRSDVDTYNQFSNEHNMQKSNMHSISQYAQDPNLTNDPQSFKFSPQPPPSNNYHPPQSYSYHPQPYDNNSFSQSISLHHSNAVVSHPPNITPNQYSQDVTREQCSANQSHNNAPNPPQSADFFHNKPLSSDNLQAQNQQSYQVADSFSINPLPTSVNNSVPSQPRFIPPTHYNDQRHQSPNYHSQQPQNMNNQNANHVDVLGASPPQIGCRPSNPGTVPCYPPAKVGGSYSEPQISIYDTNSSLQTQNNKDAKQENTSTQENVMNLETKVSEQQTSQPMPQTTQHQPVHQQPTPQITQPIPQTTQPPLSLPFHQHPTPQMTQPIPQTTQQPPLSQPFHQQLTPQMTQSSQQQPFQQQPVSQSLQGQQPFYQQPLKEQPTQQHPYYQQPITQHLLHQQQAQQPIPQQPFSQMSHQQNQIFPQDVQGLPQSYHGQTYQNSQAQLNPYPYQNQEQTYAYPHNENIKPTTNLTTNAYQHSTSYFPHHFQNEQQNLNLSQNAPPLQNDPIQPTPSFPQQVSHFPQPNTHIQQHHQPLPQPVVHAVPPVPQQISQATTQQGSYSTQMQQHTWAPQTSTSQSQQNPQHKL